MKKAGQYIKWFLIFAVLVAVDQITKQLAVMELKGTSGFPIINNVFKLYYLENHGAAFGIFQNQRIPLLIITIIVLFFIGLIFSKVPQESKFIPVKWILVTLAAGAVGNMIDRMLNGYVVDFLYFQLINFPVFNVADCYVVISAVLAAILIIFFYDEKDLDNIMKR